MSETITVAFFAGIICGILLVWGWFVLSLHLSYLRTTKHPPWYARIFKI